MQMNVKVRNVSANIIRAVYILTHSPNSYEEEEKNVIKTEHTQCEDVRSVSLSVSVTVFHWIGTIDEMQFERLMDNSN